VKWTSTMPKASSDITSGRKTVGCLSLGRFIVYLHEEHLVKAFHLILILFTYLSNLGHFVQ
jgi:hypothetical protein